jgi:hypothetical protein
MGLCLLLQLVFPSQNVFNEEVLLDLVEKTKPLYVLLALSNCLSTTTTYDLWMSIDAHDFSH